METRPWRYEGKAEDRQDHRHPDHQGRKKKEGVEHAVEGADRAGKKAQVGA